MTIFPILFAILLARAIRKLAAWKLENGSSLESLEQLMGSVTIGGTLSTIYTLRSHNFLAAGLVAVWALSPIGGQASLFLIHTELEPVFSNINVTYPDTNGYTLISPGDNYFVMEPLNALLSASLMAPTSIKNSNLDLWGNVKIPNSLPAGAINSSGWIPMTEADNTGSYTSLLGIPVVKNFASGNTTFLMETSYVSVSCLNVTSGPPIKVGEVKAWELTHDEFLSGAFRSSNETFSTGVTFTRSVTNLSFALDGFDIDSLPMRQTMAQWTQPFQTRIRELFSSKPS